MNHDFGRAIEARKDARRAGAPRRVTRHAVERPRSGDVAARAARVHHRRPAAGQTDLTRVCVSGEVKMKAARARFGDHFGRVSQQDAQLARSGRHIAQKRMNSLLTYETRSSALNLVRLTNPLQRVSSISRRIHSMAEWFPADRINHRYNNRPSSGVCTLIARSGQTSWQQKQRMHRS